MMGSSQEEGGSEVDWNRLDMEKNNTLDRRLCCFAALSFLRLQRFTLSRGSGYESNASWGRKWQP
jgi:hypothetical protein